MILQAEYNNLLTRYNEIQAKELRRSNYYFGALSLFYTIQFAVSGYTIYGVPWLGWDLVEPLTFTVS